MGLTKAQLEALNDSSFPNNNAGAITPAILRDYNTEAILNTVNQDVYTTDSASFDSRIDSLVASTASYVTSAITASSLVTASFDTNTRNLTFTKGNSTAFSVNIPDVSGSTIDTSSLATTGSNSFRGTQTLLETGSWGGVLLNVQSGSIKFNGQVADTGFSATGSIFLSPVNLPHGSTKVVFQTEYQSGSTTPNGNDYILGIGRQGDTTTKTVDLGTDTTLDVSRANLVGFPFTTTASFNLFSGSQYKNDSSSFDSRIDGISVDTSSLVSTSSFNAYTQSTNDTIAGLTTTASFNSYTQSNNSTIAGLINTISITGSQGSAVNPGVINTLQITDLDGTTRYLTLTDQNVLNTTFATTGSNTFVGSQWFSDTADTNSYSALSEWSGSLILSAKGYSTSSFPQLTSSLANPAGVGFVNLLFKGDGVAANTILSGSNNILANPVAPTATFYRQVGNGNLALTGLLPQVSASMLFPITMNGNTILGASGNPIIMRGPVSSSAWTINSNNLLGGITIGGSTAMHAERIVNGLTVTANSVAGVLSIFANQSTLAGNASSIQQNNINGQPSLILSSSNITFNGNTINSTPTITNQYFSGSLGFGNLAVSNNTIGGGAHTLIVSGGMPAGAGTNPSIASTAINGVSNTIYSNVAGANVSSSVVQASSIATHIFGANLIVSASAGAAQFNTIGSAFIGRYNDISNNKAKTGETVFAVGTGNTVTRKTGFLIDSGSNTFVEGTFNVSGSTSTTGSITIQSGSGDLFVHGHKQFNLGAFQSNINQSGSAGVSQSMQFEVTDLSYGVTMASNSQITIANAGTYNIQFSAQLLADAGADDVYIWLKKNGTNVSATAGHVTLANNDEAIAAWNYVIDAAANDYYEIAWQSTNGDAILLAQTATGNIPSIPSIILTVTQAR